jgi:ATP-dependent DNA helicase DinG
MKDIQLTLAPRKTQIEALTEFKNAIQDNKKFIIANMPVGTGKSYFGIMAAHWYNYNVKEIKIDVLTNSKLLQDQYNESFPEMKVIKGKDNYHCDTYNTSCARGADLCKATGNNCTNCPYTEAKHIWEIAKTGLCNYHVYFALGNASDRAANFLIIDECHQFEKTVCSLKTVFLNRFILEGLGLSPKESEELCNDALHDIPSNTINWIKKVQNYLSSEKNKVLNFLKKSTNKLKLKQLGDISNLLTVLNDVLSSLEVSNNNWITETKTTDKGDIQILIKPIWGTPFLKEIWENYDAVICMSGTIVNPDLFAAQMGFELDKCYYFEQDSPFPVESRPIKIIDVGAMNYNNKHQIFEKQKVYLEKIIKKHKSEKGIIHTTTYELANKVMECFKGNSRIRTHKSASDKDEVLLEHYNSKDPLVIVSPSMTTGVDFKDDLSRFQIILKVPYPFLGDSWIIARKDTQPSWYASEAASEIVQAYGRSIRSETDWANTYILDSALVGLINKNPNIFPKYFLNAIEVLQG